MSASEEREGLLMRKGCMMESRASSCDTTSVVFVSLSPQSRIVWLTQEQLPSILLFSEQFTNVWPSVPVQLTEVLLIGDTCAHVQLAIVVFVHEDAFSNKSLVISGESPSNEASGRSNV